jgi:hypothetical protein
MPAFNGLTGNVIFVGNTIMATAAPGPNFVEYRNTANGEYSTFLLGSGCAVGPFESVEQGKRFLEYIRANSSGYSIWQYNGEGVADWMKKFMAGEPKK